MKFISVCLTVLTINLVLQELITKTHYIQAVKTDCHQQTVDTFKLTLQITPKNNDCFLKHFSNQTKTKQLTKITTIILQLTTVNLKSIKNELHK